MNKKEFINKWHSGFPNSSDILYKEYVENLNQLINSVQIQQIDEIAYLKQRIAETKEDCAKEINLLDEYIELLGNEVSRVGGLSIVKPYLQASPDTIIKGEKLREKIKAIRKCK